MKYITNSEKETRNLIKKILNISPSQNAAVYVLEGDLGAGKTTFVKGLEDVFNIQIKSPTFNIIKRYQIDYKGFKNLYHIDFYRVNSVEGLDFEKLLKDPQNLIFIEWGSNVKKYIPSFAKWIYFKYLDKNTREIIYEAEENN
ncbi:MAG: tRNA (adenosine(37)-N6)-threonylcarbamoyltransferase complex ATPase subunit type 1 TsaE [Candidatus Pacebacteria bacterium]|nr:tRNA (adenosine(37)-N6)-threonylcarbamoyltransferase complex ATPase subunit type 1 TsaE [Candidatus Paceibacterota bacterium]